VLFIILLLCLRSDIVILDMLIVLLTYLLTYCYSITISPSPPLLGFGLTGRPILGSAGILESLQRRIFFHARCPCCHPTNSVKALKGYASPWRCCVLSSSCLLAHKASMQRPHLVTLRAVHCNRSCLWVCGCVCVCACRSVTMITRNCVYRSSPNWVCR